MIKRWAREVTTGPRKQRIDLVVDDAAIELKTALYGRQKGELWRLPDYDAFIVPDVNKLAELKTRWVNFNHFYVVIFAVKSPPALDWELLLERIAVKRGVSSVELDRVDDVGGRSLSIGWLRVR